MTVRLTETFDSGVDGATITAGGNIASVTGSPTYTSDAKHGGMALRGVGAVTAAVRILVSPGTATHSGSAYVKVSGVTGSGVARVVQFDTSGGTGLGSIRFHNDGLIDLAAGSARQDSSSFSWVADEWVRLDWQFDAAGAAGVVTVRLFKTDPEGTVPDDTITGTINSGTLGRWQFGDLGGGTGSTITTDTIRIADGLEWIGPFVEPEPEPGTVTHAIVGAPTPAGFRVKALVASATSCRLAVSTSPAMTSPTYQTAQAPDSESYVDFTVSGLAAGTQYYWQLTDTPDGGDESLIGEVGKARTLPAAGSASFTFAFGACITNNAADGAALTDLRTWDPDFWLHLGDFHYRDPEGTTEDSHRTLYEAQITGAAGLAQLLREVPLAGYCRSDHDAGPGDNEDPGPEAPSGFLAVQRVFPLYGLADTSTPKRWLGQTFVVGRIRFIVLDTRNLDKSLGAATDDASKTMLGAAQKAWLLDQLATTEPVKVVVSDVPWIGAAQNTIQDDNDKWWAYNTERTELGAAMAAQNVVLLQGDNHFLSVDNGSHNSWGGFHVWGAAPFHNVGGGRFQSSYTSIYNTTLSVAARQYGRVTVTDTGTLITLAFSGWDATSGVERISDVVAFSTVEPEPEPEPPAARGGWGSLHAIVLASRQARREAARPPAACPFDGEPLVRGPGGVLECTFHGGPIR